MNNFFLQKVAPALLSVGMVGSVQASAVYSGNGYTRQQRSQSIAFSQPEISGLPPKRSKQQVEKSLLLLSSRSLQQQPDVIGAIELVQGEAGQVKLTNTPQSIADDDLDLVMANPIRELMIIDEAVPNKGLFYKTMKANMDIVLINSTKDGLVQLVEVLKQYNDLDALHVVSHAQDGVLELGNSRVTEQLLRQEMAMLAQLDHALKDGADVFLYGCNFAKSQKGKDFLELVSNVAHVDIAASNDLTGHAAKGGDWDLEIRVGDIDSAQAFSALALKDFEDVLVAANATYTFAGWSGSTTNTLSTTDFQATVTDDGVAAALTITAGDAYVTNTNAYGNHIITLASDGVNTASFELTNISLTEYVNNSNLSGIYILGNKVGGGTVKSVNTVASDNTLLETWTAANFDLAAFSGVQLSSFEIHITSFTSGTGPANLNFNSFSIINGTAPTSNSSPTGSVTVSGVTTQGQTLTANNTLSDTDGLGTFTYTWKRGGTTVGTNSATYTLVQADVGSTVTCTISYTDGGGTPESVSSAATTTVINVNDLPTGGPTISGTTTEGQTLLPGHNFVDLDGMTGSTVLYQWKRGITNIGAGGNYILVQADVGNTLTLTASYTDDLGAAESATSSATAVIANVNDVPTGSVTISGTTTEGQTLTAANNLADIDGLGTISYTWKRGVTTVGTGASYVPVQADVGNTLTVTAGYTDGQGTVETVSSVATAAIVNVNDQPTFTATPTISGTAAVGKVLSLINTATADIDNDTVTLNYQWQAGGVDIVGGTGATFTITSTQAHKTITCDVTADDGQGAVNSTLTVTTAGVAIQNAAPIFDAVPSITQTSGSVGDTLLLSNTAVSDADADVPVLSYQWRANGVDITGAVFAFFTATSSQAHQAIDCVITADDTSGSGNSKIVTTVATLTLSNSLPVLTGAPAISGSPASVGNTLSLLNTATSDADGDTVTLSYQWQSNGVDIVGATGATYTLTFAEAHDSITCVINGNDGNGGSLSTTNTEAIIVSNAAPTFTGVPAVSGTALVGSVLSLTGTATTDGDNDAVSLSYQWQADGVDIAGANNATYTLTHAETLKAVTCVITAIDGQGGLTNGTTPSVTAPDNTAPVFVETPLADVTTEATAKSTPLTLTAPVATDQFTVSISHNAPSEFSVGTTVVQWTATDVNNQVSTATQKVIVTDSVAPEFSNKPLNITLLGDSVLGGQSNTLATIETFLSMATASDLIDGIVVVTNDSPALYAVNSTTVVTFTATDSSGNSSTFARTVTVNAVEDAVNSGTGLTVTQSENLGLNPNSDTTDTDGDGILDIIEIGDPNDPYDLDNDGVLDAFESGELNLDASIASGLPVSSGSVAINSTGQKLSGISHVVNAAVAPDDVDFPFGELSYTTSVKQGGTQEIVVTYSEPLPENLIIYLVDANGSYIKMPDLQWKQIDANSIKVTLKDGGNYDLDGLADGSIVQSITVGGGLTKVVAAGGGFGCSLQAEQSRFDPLFPMLVILSAFGLFKRRRKFNV